MTNRPVPGLSGGCDVKVVNGLVEIKESAHRNNHSNKCTKSNPTDTVSPNLYKLAQNRKINRFLVTCMVSLGGSF